MKFPLFNTSLRSNIAALLICLMALSGLANGQIRIFADESTDVSTEKGPDVSSMKEDEPILWQGNPSCKALNDSGNSAFAHIRNDRELKLDFTPLTSTRTYPFTPNDSAPVRMLVGPSDPANSVTTRRIGNTLNWTSTKGIAAVIVKGGSKANVYVYSTPAFGGNELKTPNNGSYGISHVSFCYYTPGKVTIIKEVQTFNGGNASTVPFPFAATNLSAGSFSLVDNNSQPADRYVDSNVYSVDGIGTIIVKESLVQNWTLADITCTEIGDDNGLQNQQNTTIDFANRKALIRVEQGECVICTFKNLQLTPTAADASVGGRVFGTDGRGISRAVLTVLDVNTSEERTVYTNAFGHFKVSSLPVGHFYIVRVGHKRYKFETSEISFTLDDTISNLDFLGNL